MSTQRSIAKGAAWMIAVRVTDRLIGFVSLLILARMLTPSDFGLVALAFSVLEVIYLLGAFNFDVALIQNQEAGTEQYDTVWTINFLFFIGYALLLAGLAVPAAHFYNDDRLVHVMLALSVGLLIRGAENVYLVDFRKNMRFDQEFLVFIVKRLSTFVLTTTLAIVLRNYWALVFGTLLGFLISTIFSYRVVKRRPRLTLVAAKQLFHFSKWMFFHNVMSTLMGRAPDFVIGRVLGAASLGIFNVAREIAALPSSELMAPINRAAFPGFSKLSKQLPALREAYLNTLGLSLLFAIPASTGIGVLAQIFVDVALGAQWKNAAPLIQIIATGGVITVLSASAGQIFIAVGKPRLNALTVGLQIPVLFPLLYFLGRDHGLEGAAMAIAINAALIAPVSLFIVSRELDISLVRFVSVMWRPCLASLAMAAVLLPMLPAAEGSRSREIIALIAMPAAGVCVFAATLALLAWMCGGASHAERIVLAEIQLRWRRFRRFDQPLSGVE